MTVIDLRTFETTSSPKQTVLCLGNFDGVHVGHQKLIVETLTRADALRGEYPEIKSGVWFFRRAPLEIIADKPLPHIADLRQKLEIFAELGLDLAYIYDYEDIGDFSPRRFVDEILKKECGCVFAVCGFNFKFGYKAMGTAGLLSDLMNGNASIVEPITLDGETVSSSKIRQCIADGQIEKVNTLLGRNYSIKSTVIHGKQLGRKLGIPTINQRIGTDMALLKKGIYVSRSNIDGQWFPSVSNIGLRPSVEDSSVVNCETYIIGFNGDLYDREIKVEFLKRLRDEKKFDSVDALKAQINADIEYTKEYFGI